MSRDPFDMTGKVAVVTGGGRGLGRTISAALAERGAKVALLGRKLDALADQESRLNDLHGAGIAQSFVCDVADEESVSAAVEAVASSFGRADALFNNAGVTWGEPLTSIKRERWDKVFATNTTGVMMCSRGFLPLLAKDGGGSITVVSSATANRGVGFMRASAYTASKAAAEQFVREAAVEWASQGVRVNSLRLGFFGSDMTDAFLAMGSNMETVQSMTPLGRVGTDDDLRGIIQFLGSDASAYVTGAIHTVDGGALATLGPAR